MFCGSLHDGKVPEGQALAADLLAQCYSLVEKIKDSAGACGEGGEGSGGAGPESGGLSLPFSCLALRTHAPAHMPTLALRTHAPAHMPTLAFRTHAPAHMPTLALRTHAPAHMPTLALGTHAPAHMPTLALWDSRWRGGMAALILDPSLPQTQTLPLRPPARPYCLCPSGPLPTPTAAAPRAPCPPLLPLPLWPPAHPYCGMAMSEHACVLLLQVASASLCPIPLLP